MSSKAPLILGGLALAAVALYFATRSSAAPAANAAASPAPNALKAPTPKVTDPTAWTPPVGYQTLPAGWTLPDGAVPQAGWIPPLNWQAPAWLTAIGWAPGQPIPGIPLPAPALPAGTPTVQAIAPGPRGDAVAAQRAYKLGFDDGGASGWSIPGIPNTMFGLPPIPGLTGAATTNAAKEMAQSDKLALWQTLFANKIKWINYCYDPATPCMTAKGTIGDPFVAGGKGALMAQDVAYLNDASTPRDNTYDNPGWYVLYSPSTGVFWMLEETPALTAATTDDWTIFLRPSEYHNMQVLGGPQYTVPDDINAATTTGEATTKQGLFGIPGTPDISSLANLPGFGSNIPVPSIPGMGTPYTNGLPGIPNPGGGGGLTLPKLPGT